MATLHKTTFERIREGQLEYTCPGCQRTFYRYPNNYARVTYCSRECQYNNQKGRPPRPIPTTPQVCRKCGETKPPDAFVTSVGGFSYHCRPCRQPTQEQKRRSHLKQKFGITLGEWVALYEAQNGACPICERVLPTLDELFKAMSREDSWKSRNWNTDHCHKTGRVRGITCRGCNVGLGAFHDDPATLRRAAEYIERHRDVTSPASHHPLP